MSSQQQTNYMTADVLNATDLKRQIVSIDSRFRDFITESSTDFLYRFERPYKNIVRAKIVSTEIPLTGILALTERKMNTWFYLKVFDAKGIERVVQIVVPEAIYTPMTLIDAIQYDFNQFKETYGIFMTIELVLHTNQVKICNLGTSSTVPIPPGMIKPDVAPQPFILDFYIPDFDNRISDWGLGYNLGFRQKYIQVDTLEGIQGSEIICIVSRCIISVAPDPYYLLAIDDYYAVDHKTNQTYVQAMAKILTTNQGAGYAYNGTTLLTNEVVFPSPTDLKQLRIRLLDPYGVPVQMFCDNFSFSLELTEAMSSRAYERFRWGSTVSGGVK